jgi:hypothetical protein
MVAVTVTAAVIKDQETAIAVASNGAAAPALSFGLYGADAV